METHTHTRRWRPAFTAVEVLLTIGVLGMSAGVAVPVYRQYVIRNDLEIARQNVSQGIQRARFLSQSALNDSSWGFSTDAVPSRGVLFMGNSYATRDAEFDEMYSIPETISVSGITEVSFEKITGVPSESGTITLTALNGEERIVSINIGEEGTVSNPDDWMEICVDPYGDNPRTIQVPDSLWEVYQEDGALLGSCSEQADDDGSGQPGPENPADFTIDGDTVTGNVDFTCTVDVMGADISYGGYYDLNVTANFRFGSTWIDPFGDWTSATQGNVNNGEVHSYTCGSIFPAGTSVDAKGRSWEKKKFWYSGDDDRHWNPAMTKHTINNDNSNIIVLRDGDAIPDVPGFQDQSSVSEFVADYVDFDTGLMDMDAGQAMYLFELGTNDLDSDAADFQDLVILLSLEAV